MLAVLGEENPRRVDWAPLLPRITCPALLITADPDLGGIVTGESAAALKGIVPHLEIVQVPGAGHNIRRDRFERYIEAVRSFLAAKT